MHNDSDINTQFAVAEASHVLQHVLQQGRQLVTGVPDSAGATAGGGGSSSSIKGGGAEEAEKRAGGV